VSRELRTLLERLRAALGAAQQQLPLGSSGDLAPGQAVHLCASLDAAYYALLERHLSSRGRTPAVPPPHVYFPALAAAHPGCQPVPSLAFSVCEAILCAHAPVAA
jgi:hypothetical protein